MRVQVWLALVFLWFLQAPLAQEESSDVALVLLYAEEEAGPALAQQGFLLVASLPEGYLALMSQDETVLAINRGVPLRILDPRVSEDSEYVTAFDVESTDDDVREIGVALFRGDGYRLLKVPRLSLEQTTTHIPRDQLIFRRPLSFVGQSWKETAVQGVDRDIQAMVEAVNIGALKTRVLKLQDFGSRHSMHQGGNQASVYIRNYLLARGYTEVSFHDYNDWNDNVLCVKPGAVNPNQYVVLTAHYDSETMDIDDAPGADDNATGTAGVLEAARVMADYEFQRSVIFIAFSGEEQGLVGSEHWAAEAAEAGMNIVGVVNMDMLCYLDEDDAEDLDIISNKASLPLMELAAEAIATYVPDLAQVRGRLKGATSDHAAFWHNGYRAITFIEDAQSYSPYIHTPNDIVGLSAKDFDFMLKNVRAAVATVATLAHPHRADTQP